MNNRRDFLTTSGAASSALLFAPFMNHMKAHAAGKESGLPKRFVFISKSNEFKPATLLPKGFENYDARGKQRQYGIHSTEGMQFNDESMKSLNPYMDQITNLQGLSSKVVQAGGGHANIPGVYGCYADAAGGHGPPRAITIEPALGNELPSIFNHLSFEMGDEKDNEFKYSKISALGRNSPAPTYVSPVYAYKEIFGSVATTENAKNELASKRNVLDFLVDDVKNLKKQLTSEEKEKLDHYLHGFEALNKRQEAIAGHGIDREQRVFWKLTAQRRLQGLGRTSQDPVEDLPTVERLDYLQIGELEMQDADRAPLVQHRAELIDVNGESRQAGRAIVEHGA